ncbi:MAG: 5-formyltetrahydrofolate cyclo-ligase [Elusimicrobiota bacterium]|nr:5-formyltetrahydrofolate cyclo-ligase [Elusimicrobiota bacterium]
MKNWHCLNKKELRKKFISLRNGLDEVYVAQSSAEISKRVQSLQVYQDAKTVMIYISYRNEVSTVDLIKSALSAGKRVCVPAVTNIDKAEMEAFEISTIGDADETVLGICQPNPKTALKISKAEIDLTIIPGIVFDERGFRIGYGKGFFDRRLKGMNKSRVIGLAYDFQIIKEILVDACDEAVGGIVSQTRILKL